MKQFEKKDKLQNVKLYSLMIKIVKACIDKTLVIKQCNRKESPKFLNLSNIFNRVY